MHRVCQRSGVAAVQLLTHAEYVVAAYLLQSGAIMQKTTYRLYTQDAGFAFSPIIRHYFDGATIATVHGMWRDHVEYSAVIEIIADSDRATLEKIAALAGELAEKGKQDSVMVTETPVIVREFTRNLQIKGD